ncbi:MAG: family 16 glycoside hydrolase [Verrucomicrobiota bacterium]
MKKLPLVRPLSAFTPSITPTSEDGLSHFRVIAVGDRITTWINGQNVFTATVPPELIAAYSSGFVGLQVQGIKEIKKPSNKPAK